MKDDFWVAESSEKPFVCKKRKRRVVKRKLEFVGWGSKQLIEFLEVIGQDTSKKHSRHDVATFITKYINDKGLASAEKKKKVMCDERLYDLFLKKSMSRIKIYDLLEEHFAENHDDSDDELLDSLEEEDYGERRSLVSKYNPTGQKKKVPKTPKSCFAAVIPENIKLIYLKRSLIQELLKVPESFELKLIGSFVRMKSDPNDIYQKNRFQLQLVTGVEKISGDGNANTEVRLRVSNFFKDISICMLSDDDFSEEEIEDVRDRIKAGLLERLTVTELESKAQILHVEITKHWIAREISLLQKLIDRANEKGWRRELFEYLERRKRLQTPSEQEKLLHKIPEVIAEELEPEGTVADAAEKAEGSGCSPKSILRGSSDVSSGDASGSGDVASLPEVMLSDSPTLKVKNEDVVPVNDPNDDQPAVDTIQQETWIPEVIGDGNSGVEQVQVVVPQEKPEKVVDINQVIDLSDDESEDEHSKVKDQSTLEYPDKVIWHYADPQGQTQGPFSLYSLKRWSDANYFHPSFRVWKSGQKSDGVLLVDVLQRCFSR